MENAERTHSERLLTKKQSDVKLKQICMDLFKVRQQQQEMKERYGVLQAKLKEYFGTSGDKSLQYSVGNRSFKVTDVSPQRIVWDCDKLRERLKQREVDSSVIKKVIESSYAIVDWDGFVSVLKKFGVKPNDVLPFLEVQRKVNQKKIDELSEIGEITKEDIDGCFEVQQTEGYLKFGEWEVEEENE